MPKDIAISMKGIKSAKLKKAGIRTELLNALRKEGTAQRKALRPTTSTWRGETPAFESLIGLDGEAATVVTGPVGSGMGVKKWFWLNAGTKIRWALMSSGWKSKTSPGNFKSGGGGGRPVLIGKRAFKGRGMRARPGIAARNWTILLTKMRRKPWIKATQAAMKKGANKLF